MHRQLSALLKDIADEARMSPREVEQGMGRPYSSIRDELNPNRAAKFGVDDLLAFMETFETTAPLEWLAAKLGYRLVAVNAKPDGRNMDHECNQAVVTLGKFLDAIEEGKTSKETYPLLQAHIKESEDCWVRQRDEEIENCKLKVAK